MNTAKLLQYEDGMLTFEETVELFQALINSGLVWQLQGFYGRQAMTFIKNGNCERPQETKKC